MGPERPRKAHDVASFGNLPRFSPDGRWLAISGDRGTLIPTETWEPGPVISGLAAFSSDGKTLVVETGKGLLRLLETATGKEIGRLADPTDSVAERLRFTDRDAKLLTLGNGLEPGVRAWDLELIRRNLTALDLDWPMPHLVPAKESPPLPPLEVD